MLMELPGYLLFPSIKGIDLFDKSYW